MNLSKLFADKSAIALKNNGNVKKLLFKKLICSILYFENQKTIADLCIPSGVSIPTMTRLMNELKQEGWVLELGTGKSRGGRKPVLYGLNPSASYVLGVEMTKKYTRANIYNLHNVAVGEAIQLDIELEDAPAILEILKTSIDTFIDSSGINRQDIIGAGIIMPGLIDKKTSVNHIYKNLGEKPLNIMFSELFQIPSYIEHNTKAMAMAESWFGLAKNKSNVLCLNVGSGVGMGIIMNSELYQGHSGFSGEFGHIQLVPDGELCYCGKIGCLETVASGPALVARARKKIAKGENSIINKLTDSRTTEIKLPVIIEAAHQGDQFAIELIEESALFLARGLAMMIHLFNPEMIIIGGDMARAENLLSDPIQHQLSKYTLSRIRQDAQIFVSELKEQSGLLGTIPVVMNNIFLQEPNIINTYKLNKL